MLWRVKKEAKMRKRATYCATIILKKTQKAVFLVENHDYNLHDSTGTRLMISVLFNLGVTAAEIVGGLLSDSLSLLSDALHNFTDAMTLVISYVARHIAKREKDSVFTYGHERAKVVASIINVTVFLSISVLLFKEAVAKILNRYTIDTDLMLWVAFVGLVGNFATATILLSKSKRNPNVRSTFLHIVSDALSSMAVVVGGLLIKFHGWWFVDPLIAFAIVAYVVVGFIHILGESLRIVMQAVSKGISVEEVKKTIESLDMVKDGHHIHIWSSDGKDVYVECHATLSDSSKSIDTCIDKIEKKPNSLGIKHVTVQLEEGHCRERKEC